MMQIKLPDFLIAELYKKSLIISNGKMPSDFINENDNGAKKVQKSAAHKNEKPFLGDNEKKITILTDDAEAEFLSDELLQLLAAILSACNLKISDVAIVNILNNNLSYIDIKAQFNPRYILLFNVTASQINLPFSIPNYQIQEYDNCSFLFAPGLKTMLTEDNKAKNEKRKLWNSLKKIFSV